jgi:hypothetical protein
MKKRFVVLCGLLLVATVAVAEDFVASLKHPAPGWTTYGDIRLRQKYGWKMTDLDDSHHNFGRYRARIGQRIEIDEDITFDARLMWEFRAWRDGGDRNVDFGYAIIDRLSIKFDNMFDMPLTGRFGRQDIMINPWLIFDGAPYTGSTTLFFDAAWLTFDFDTSATKVDLIYIDNHADPKDTLGAIGNRDFALTEQNEHGAILYLTNKSFEDTTIEGYFIYKNDRAVHGMLATDRWSRKAEIFTLGGAYSKKIDANWQYRIEGAVQTGDRENRNGIGTRDLRAWGTNNKLVYNFNDERKSNLAFEYEFLSGDDSSDGKDRGFDPLWGQWPRFSELYIYTYTREASLAELTNLHRAAVTYDFNPIEKMNFKNSYQLLWADQADASLAAIRGGSYFRGHLLTSQLSYKFTKDLSGRINAEYFIPGDYYADTNQRNATFVRAEVVYSF